MQAAVTAAIVNIENLMPNNRRSLNWTSIDGVMMNIRNRANSLVKML